MFAFWVFLNTSTPEILKNKNRCNESLNKLPEKSMFLKTILNSQQYSTHIFYTLISVLYDSILVLGLNKLIFKKFWVLKVKGSTFFCSHQRQNKI